MDLAMHTWMRIEPIEKSIARMVKNGCKNVEIAIYEDYSVSEAKRCLGEYGVSCWGGVTLMIEGRSLISSNEEVRKKSIAYVKQTIDTVHELGGKVLSLVPGEVGKVVPESSPEKEWNWAVEGISELADYAQEKNVRIGIEPINRFETFFINRVEQAVSLAKAVGKGCGVAIDIFHMSLEEHNLYESLERLEEDMLVNVHVASNDRFAPGMGRLDWKRIVASLKKLSYQGCLSLEFSPPIDRTPANRYSNMLETDKSNLTELEKKFLEDHGSGLISDEFYTYLLKKSVQTLSPLL